MSDNDIGRLQVTLAKMERQITELHVAVCGDQQRGIEGLVNKVGNHENRLNRVEIVGFTAIIIITAGSLGLKSLSWLTRFF